MQVECESGATDYRTKRTNTPCGRHVVVGGPCEKGWDTDHHQEVSVHMGLNRKFTEWVEGSGSWGPLKLAFTVT